MINLNGDSEFENKTEWKLNQNIIINIFSQKCFNYQIYTNIFNLIFWKLTVLNKDGEARGKCCDRAYRIRQVRISNRYV